MDNEEVTSDSFIQKINQGLADKDWLVLVMTPESLRSKWVMREVDAAFNLVNAGRMRSIIPIVAKPCDEADIPPLLGPFLRYDATNDYQAAFTSLCHALWLSPSVPSVAKAVAVRRAAVPAQPTTYETCEIKWHLTQKWPIYKFAFYAEAIGPHGMYNAGQSKEIVNHPAPDKGFLGAPHGKSEPIVSAFIAQLYAQGWESVPEKGPNWWSYRFRRSVKR